MAFAFVLRKVGAEMQQLVTVFLVTYYNCELISKAVEKIAKQDYPRIELIISDDGTPNYSKEKMEQDVEPYRKYFENVIVNKNTENQGTVKHLNKVISLLNGEIICGIGIDDSFANEHVVSEIVDYFEKNKDISVVTSKRYEEAVSHIKPSKYVQKMLYMDQDKYRKQMFRITPQISNIGTFYRKDCFIKYGFYPEEFRLVEDAPYLSKLIAKQVKMGWLDSVTTIHAAGGVSCKGKKVNEAWFNDRVYLYEKWMPTLLEKDDSFSIRCLRFHTERCKAKSNSEILISFLKYLDVCAYLFSVLGMETLKEAMDDIRNIRKSK